MTEPITARTPLVCSDERHAAKVADLESQLSRMRDLLRTEKERADRAIDRETTLEEEVEQLHAGEEDGYVEFTEPTAGQWLWKFNRITPEQRLNVITALLRDAARGRTCFFMAHEKRAEEDGHAWVALARVRNVLADMENITGARHWARILRTAVDGEKRPTVEEQRDQYAALVRDFLDSEPCRSDHHGHCQTHGWTTVNPACPHYRAREQLAALDQSKEA